MNHRRRDWVVLLGTLCCHSIDAWAFLSIEERLPLIRRRARLLRDGLLKHPHGTQHIERTYNDALQAAEAHWDSGEPDLALAELSALQTYAPVAELPFVKAQLLMAAIAGQQKRPEDKIHHRAFALALVQEIERDADGTNANHAYKLALPSEATAWLISKGEGYKLVSQTPLLDARQHLHVWRIESPSGIVFPVYFRWTDVPATDGKKSRNA